MLARLHTLTKSIAPCWASWIASAAGVLGLMASPALQPCCRICAASAAAPSTRVSGWQVVPCSHCSRPGASKWNVIEPAPAAATASTYWHGSCTAEHAASNAAHHLTYSTLVLTRAAQEQCRSTPVTPTSSSWVTSHIATTSKQNCKLQ